MLDYFEGLFPTALPFTGVVEQARTVSFRVAVN
jgi:hypothetical protein